ncbi:MAG: hypothetical protein PHG67_06065 [Bacteroidales bacterium]|nr:hypothetical protein [Bacteroidales bacterium]HOI31205.1 hypothetical protein [Bacteroidales bacterium]
MIKIKGYWQYNGHKSEFKRLRLRIHENKLETLRQQLQQSTGCDIMFYRKGR